MKPKVIPEAPVSGKKYVLVNKAQNVSQYMSRTSWDGALYFLSEEESHYKDHALTAISNADGSWSFSLQVPTPISPDDTGTIWEGPLIMGSWADAAILEGDLFADVQDGDIMRLNITATNDAQLQISYGNSWTNFDGLSALPIKGTYDFAITRDNLPMLLQGIHIKGINYTLKSVRIIKHDGSETEVETVDVTNYLILPEGLANVNVNSAQPAKWILQPKENGYYNFILGEGNNSSAIAQGVNTPTGDVRMHLSKGGDYFCVTYVGGPFFPDCVGEIIQSDNEATGNINFEATDSTSFNWGLVSVDNVPAYYQDYALSSVINDVYDHYCDIAGYETGFRLTADAAAQLYYGDNPDAATIHSMIDRKKALYNELLAAKALYETADEAFDAAIENATNVFNSSTDATTISAEIETLKEAEAAYIMAIGNLTTLGQNMSFEDLTAQGGNESGSVSPAPAGWNVYINGKQALTTSDILNGGVTAWHGVNSDSYGEVKDGYESFGIWTSNVPKYEISQRIEGLANGTYIVSAGLMAGSNGSGSRLTTQRIFANDYSTYYAADYEYNLAELDKSEIFGFADNPVIQTDQEMLPVSVKAYVYDGTLTFGVRTDGNVAANNRTEANGAGGDGWFKVDNFQLKSTGYVADDAIALFRHYADQLSEYENGFKMETKVKERLSAEMSNYSGITLSSPQSEIDAAIAGASELFSLACASVEAYERLDEALILHNQYLVEYSNMAGAGEYGDVIMEVTNNMEDGIYDVAGVEAAFTLLEQALQDCKQSGTIEEGADLTEYIQNASFEDLSNQGNNSTGGVVNAPKGWNIYIDGALCNTVGELNAAGVTAWCGINGGDNLDVTNTYGEQVTHQYTDGEHLWGIWSDAIPEVEISQTITGLPAGTYTLTADMVVQNDWAGMNLGTQRLFANEYVQMFGAELDYIQNIESSLFSTFPADVVSASALDSQNPSASLKHLTYAEKYSYDDYGASGAPYTMQLTFGLAEKGDMTLGARTNRISALDGMLSSQASLGWFKLDNFHLTYESAEVPEGAEASCISSLSSGKQEVLFFNPSGIRLTAPTQGLNIIRMTDGTVRKVYIK